MTVYCSFCDKSNHDVIRMVAAPSVRSKGSPAAYICNECIVMAVDALTKPIPDIMIQKLDSWINNEKNI